LSSKVILKQQRVIKRLLKKCYGGDFCLPGNGGGSGSSRDAKDIETLVGDAARVLVSGSGTSPKIVVSDVKSEKSALESRMATELLDAQNDSDSAIMLEDHITEASRNKLSLGAIEINTFVPIQLICR
jgi:hypothetical protein